MKRRQLQQARPLRSTPAQPPLIVAGRGNLGRSLTRALRAAGRRVTLVRARTGIQALARSLESKPGALVLLTVPDGAIASVAAKLAVAGAAIPRSVAFVHLSGALGLGSLESLRDRHPVGSFHPLQSFPEPRPPDAFRGIVVAVDGTTASLQRRLGALARDIGAKPRRVDDSQRALYHAAAVFASNYLVALLGEAVGLLEQAGWSKGEATAALVRLSEGALLSVSRRGPTAALTGPIRRGDVETVRRHLVALAEIDSRRGARKVARRTDLYRMLGSIALEGAKEAGLEPAAAERVSRALTRKVAATRRRRRA
ncbi:MAG TPA: DUF2520 domain-containing protein [Candidatus Dormibacteraeota bacterium]|nr:DUF2520 domain-containing protein [Candidatus Dormibacteraeota bacterium]